MKIVERSVELLNPMSYETMLDTVERAGRNCYQSFGRMGEGSAEKLIRKFVKVNHGSPLEFADITVRIEADRAFLAQITRHRLSSFCVESARYNDYSKNDDGCAFIVPYEIEEEHGQDIAFHDWLKACRKAEKFYYELLHDGCKPETARSVLPMCLATSIVMKANVREWRHILSLRLDKRAQADMREVMEQVIHKFYNRYPVFFEDLFQKYQKG